MLNGWVQGMGYPPCARSLTHWIPPKELAFKMSVWNASANIGAGLVVVICSYLLSYYGNWRLCFFVPAGLAFLCTGFLWFRLPDTPPSVGLPEVEGTETKAAENEADDWKAVAVKIRLQQPLYLVAFLCPVLPLHHSICLARLGANPAHASQACPTRPRRLDGRRF